MLSPDDQPSIPRRPNKSPKKTNSTIVSSDCGEIEAETLVVEPLVPRRPKRSSATSDPSDQSENLSVTSSSSSSSSSIPIVPSRPRKSGPEPTDDNTQIQEPAPIAQVVDAIVPSDLTKVTEVAGDDSPSQEDSAEPLKENTGHAQEEVSEGNIAELIAHPVENILQTEESVTSTVNESVLNSMKIDGSVISGDGDGDKTPGNSNTKITFKDEDDNNSHIGSDESSFNDDVETVLQEKDDNELNCRQAENDIPNLEGERSQDSTKKVEILQLTSSNLEQSKRDLSHQIVHNNYEKAEYKDDGQQLNTENPKKKTPFVPRRPKLSETEFEKEAKLSVEDLKQGNIFKEEKEDEGTESDIGSNSSTLDPQRTSFVMKPPIVPSRPKKNINSSTLQEEGNKPRAPPPKPKKLGSRIAAFQQMLIQEPAPLQLGSKRESNPPQSFNKKLSSDKIKFAESLQGVVGKGVPLPGLANSNLILKESTQDEKERIRDYSAEPIKTRNDRRARGPKGKRLPKSLQEPVRIESESRYKLVSYDLWEVNLSSQLNKANESDKMKKGSTTVLPKFGTSGCEHYTNLAPIDSKDSLGEEISETNVSANKKLEETGDNLKEVPSESSVLKGSDKEEPSSISDDYVLIEKSSSQGEDQVDNDTD